MKTITHEGKIYCEQPATNLCEGCDFLRKYEVPECHAPDNLNCSGIIFKEMDEADRYDYDSELNNEDKKLLIQLIATILLIFGLTVAAILFVIYLLINFL